MRKLTGVLAVIGGMSLFVIMQMILYMREPLAMALDELLVAPMIAVDPTVLVSVQSSDVLVTQTLTLHNLGDSDLDWSIYDGSGSLWDQTDNASAIGAPSQYSPDVPGGGYAADDFVVSAGQTWQVDQIFVQGGYTPGAGPAPDFDMTVYDDMGGVPGTVVVSVTAVIPTNNVSGMITLEITPPITLTAGSYWLSVNANMDFVGPPHQWGWGTRTIQTGFPYQWMETGMYGTSCTSGWQAGAAVCGVGGGVDPDLAFGLHGDYLDTNCDPLSAMPWVTVNPISGTIGVSNTLPMDVTFDSTGYSLGVYTGTLCIASNDPVQPLLAVPLTMMVGTPENFIYLPFVHK